MLAVGLMSGTSFDGVDAVLCEVTGSGTSTSVVQKEFIIYPIPEHIKEKLQQCCSNEAVKIDVICSLNFELGHLFADAAIAVCKKANIKTTQLDFIASHGQTIYHIPKATKDHMASTLQIGESAVIAQRCGCKVIANFRAKDMAVGGEGAPLVPYSEYLLYRHQDYGIALQNIGGIGNMTVLPKNAKEEDVFAFDTGPGNMMINEAMEYYFQKPFDESGKVAAKGNLIVHLKEELKNHPFLSQPIPKTTGREMFGKAYTHELLNRYASYAPEDIIATLTWFSAYAIAYHFQRFVIPYYDIKELVLGGGGVHNTTLRKFLAEELVDTHIVTQEEKGYSSDAKEAVAFVILGNQTLHLQTSNIPNATGANSSVILGHITYPN